MSRPFDDFRGRNFLEKVDPDQRVALEAWEEVLRMGESGKVDCEHFIDEQLYLTPETAEYIYSDYTPLELKYERGSRPKLDETVGMLTKPEMSEFEKFLWLARFVRDLPNKHDWSPMPFTGGTEEELIEKGPPMCNEQARLMVILCQVAGLPARYVGHHIGGHGVTEVYIDGRWVYYDIRGKFFFKKDGALASTWEIWQDPEIIDSQPEWVTREVHPKFRPNGDPYLSTRKSFFNPKECTGITNYYVWDAEKYDFTHPPDDPNWLEVSAAPRRRRNAVREKFGFFFVAKV
ncbi:MAG: transglutaminase-like domain-containing protein [Planctomycetota bacterium]|jgi:hypothetical protein